MLEPSFWWQLANDGIQTGSGFRCRRPINYHHHRRHKNKDLSQSNRTKACRTFSICRTQAPWTTIGSQRFRLQSWPVSQQQERLHCQALYCTLELDGHRLRPKSAPGGCPVNWSFGWLLMGWMVLQQWIYWLVNGACEWLMIIPVSMASNTHEFTVKFPNLSVACELLSSRETLCFDNAMKDQQNNVQFGSKACNSHIRCW